MTRARGPRYTALALVLLGLGCGDAPTAPNGYGQVTVMVALAGVSAEHAGVVLQLTGALDDVTASAPSLEVAWAQDAPNVATVVVVGPLSQHANVLVVRRPGGLEPLRAAVRELADIDGAVSSSSAAYAIVRDTPTP